MATASLQPAELLQRPFEAQVLQLVLLGWTCSPLLARCRAARPDRVGRACDRSAGAAKGFVTVTGNRVLLLPLLLERLLRCVALSLLVCCKCVCAPSHRDHPRLSGLQAAPTLRCRDALLVARHWQSMLPLALALA